MDPLNFFSELKRRKVYKAAISYGITGWSLVQISSLLTRAFETPPWVLKMIIIAAIIGLPVILILSWIYDISPQGLVKTKDRRLAAIMFTKIIDNKTLTGSDEDLVLEALRKSRKIHNLLIDKYNGNIIKEMGSKMLISFNLATDAVNCAFDLLKECEEQGVLLKIGIHEGEMVFEGTDVFGDGVKIASGLHKSIKGSGIVISESVHRDVKNKEHVKTQFIKEKSFNNIDDPIKVYLVNSKKPQSGEDLSLRLKQNQRKHIISPSYAKTGSLILLLAIVSAIFFLFYSGKYVPFTERDWIVITDFENFTEETIFDKSLNTAFSLSIDQSKYINVITRKRMLETLKRMRNVDRQYIDGKRGREIAIREGIKIYLVPEISRVGNQYILTVKIQEAISDSLLRSEVIYAKNQDEIIEKLDELTKKVRRVLGESRFRIFEQSKPLVKATTSSLKALKQFSLGIDSHVNMDFDKAKIYYENAIRIDSNFTSAKASLGNLLFEKFDRNKGRKLLDEAILSIDNLTDREKYRILASYAVNIENDLEKGIEYTETLIELYPDDPISHHNLGWYISNQGLYERAIEEYKTALRIDPYLMFSYGGVNWSYLTNFAQMDSAKVWSKRMIKHGPDNPWGYFYLGSAYVGVDSLEKAKNEYLRARNLNPKFSLNQYRLAHVYRLQGMYAEAIKVLEEILKMNPKERSAHYDLGIDYDLLGDREKSRNHFLEFNKKNKELMEKNSDDPVIRIVYGLTLTRLGEKKAGWKIGKRAIDLDSTLHFSFAEFLAVQNKKNEAIDQLEKAFKNGYRDLVWIKLDPNIYLLHEENRYQELIDKYFAK
jgi:tetratricopeptide (TPR) repeat protein/class 3 adenylate cyclase